MTVVCLTTARRLRRPLTTTHPTLAAIMTIDRRLSELECSLHSLRGSRGFRERDVAFLGAEREMQRETIGLQAKRAALVGVKPVRRVK